MISILNMTCMLLNGKINAMLYKSKNLFTELPRNSRHRSNRRLKKNQV